MRIRLFAKRNSKEILREPIYFAFGLGFPLILLVLLSIINASIPAEANNPMFEIQNLAPGMAMFGSSFMALFLGMLVAKDRSTSFLIRLYASPMRAFDFLIGYAVPMILMSIGQATITLVASLIYGLDFSLTLLLGILTTTLTSFLFIGLGLLCGTLLSDKAVGGICGALITNLAGWFSGVFIPIDLIGGAFKTITRILPFYHSVEAIKAALTGKIIDILPHLGVVLLYAFIIFAIVIPVFNKVMKGNKS